MANTSQQAQQLLNESARIARSVTATRRGESIEFRNIPEAVLDAIEHDKKSLENIFARLETLERGMKESTAIIQILVDDAKVKDARYEANQSLFGGKWSQLEERVASLETMLAQVESDTNKKLGAVKDSQLRTLREDVDELTGKVELVDDINEQIHAVREQLDLVKRLKSNVADVQTLEDKMQRQIDHAVVRRPLSNGSLAQAGTGDSTPRVARIARRWTWHGATLASSRGRAISWDELTVAIGRGVEWSVKQPSCIFVTHGGIYRLTVALFHNAADRSVPALTVYINRDAVVHATDTSSSCVMRTRVNQEGSRKMEVARCSCEPVPINGLTLNDFFFFPQDSTVVVAYSGDASNVYQAVLELEALS